MKRFMTLSFCLALSFANTGCLKTRAQLRGDQDSGDSAPSSRAAPNAVQDVQPQGQYVIDELKTAITRLEGRVEDLERAQKDQTGGNAAATQDQEKKLESRVTELEQAQTNMLEAIKKMQDQPVVADPSALLQKAKTQFEAENYEDTVTSTTAFLKNAHKPSSKDAEAATFMRAESYFKLKKYKQAIADYSEFPEKYTKSKQMPEALYKIGVSFEALGSKDDAKGFYQLLVDKFPKSSQAKKVKSKLR